MSHYQQYTERLYVTFNRYYQLQGMVGTSNFIRLVELETAKKYGFTREQALALSHKEYAQELVRIFEVTYEAATGEAIKLMPEDSRRQFLNAMAGFL
jgi:hypothetical protein